MNAACKRASIVAPPSPRRPCREGGWLLACLAGTLSCVALVTAGCSESGAGSPTASAAAQPLASDPNVGRRDWPINGDGFEIDNSSAFAFFGEVDRDQLVEKMKAPPPADTAPIEIAEDLVEWVNRALSDEPAPPKVLLEISRDHVAGYLAFIWTANDEKLVTYGRDLRVWNAAAGEVEKAIDVPVEGVQGVTCDRAGRYAVLASPGKLTAVDLSTDEVVGQIDDLDGEVLSWRRARDADIIVGRTSRDRVFVATPQLTRFAYLPVASDAPLSHLIIAPDGKQIASTRDDYAVLWQKGDEAPLGENRIFRADGKIRWASVGSEYFYWATGKHLIRQPRPQSVYAGMQELASERTAMAWLPFGVWSLTLEDGEDWPLVWAAYRTEEKERVDLLFDLEYRRSNQQSSPWILEPPHPQQVIPNGDGTRVAILRSSGLKLYERTRWHPMDESVLKNQVSWLAWNGRFDQLEQIARAVLQGEQRRFGMSAHELHSEIADEIGSTWYYIEQDEEQADLQEKLGQWHTAGSELALVASAYRHVEAGWAARGGGYTDSVTEEGWRVFGERLELARDDLDIVLQRESPPLAAFAHRVTVAKGLGEDYEVIDPVLKRAVELYPGEVLPHTSVATWLLPRWGGAVGAIGAYTRKLAAIYPPEVSDPIIARMAIEVCNFVPENMFAVEIGFDPERTFNGARLLMEQGYQDRDGVEALWWLSYTVGESELISKILRYHQRTFATYGRLLDSYVNQ